LAWASIGRRLFLGAVFFHGTFISDFILGTLMVIAAGVCVLNSLGIVFQREFGAYFLAVLVWFAVAIDSFVIVLFWKDEDNPTQ
jgi:hypothetical protein